MGRTVSLSLFFLDSFRYFMKDPSGTVLSVQQGVFRTNCMDCLDRTNVVQSLLAHRALQHQLQVCMYDLSVFTLYIRTYAKIFNTVLGSVLCTCFTPCCTCNVVRYKVFTCKLAQLHGSESV